MRERGGRDALEGAAANAGVAAAAGSAASQATTAALEGAERERGERKGGGGEGVRVRGRPRLLLPTLLSLITPPRCPPSTLPSTP